MNMLNHNEKNIKIIEHMAQMSEHPENCLPLSESFQELVAVMVVDMMIHSVFNTNIQEEIVNLSIRMFELGRESVKNEWDVYA